MLVEEEHFSGNPVKCREICELRSEGNVMEFHADCLEIVHAVVQFYTSPYMFICLMHFGQLRLHSTED